MILDDRGFQPSERIGKFVIPYEWCDYWLKVLGDSAEILSEESLEKGKEFTAKSLYFDEISECGVIPYYIWTLTRDPEEVTSRLTAKKIGENNERRK